MSGRRPAGEGIPGDFILLGRLGKTFGLEGVLRFRPLGSSEGEAIFELDELFVEGLGITALTEVKAHGNDILVSLRGVRTVERARSLVNAQVHGPMSALPEADGGYVDALLGLPVLLGGLPIGTVNEVGGVSGNELLFVERPDGDELLLPLRAPYIQLASDAVMVEDPPDGLISGRDEDDTP